jgi:hypothetical protein
MGPYTGFNRVFGTKNPLTKTIDFSDGTTLTRPRFNLKFPLIHVKYEIFTSIKKKKN